MDTLICVPIMVEDAASALADAAGAHAAGAHLVEFRIDRVFHGEGDEEGVQTVLRVCAETPIPCIVTCRVAAEGGEYEGDEASRIALFERLGAADRPPRYIDVEFTAFTRSANLKQKVLLSVVHPKQPRDLSTGLILSAHDLGERPHNLLTLAHGMQNEDAAKIVKVAFRARSIRDNLELFDILRERTKPMIALAMGEYGLMSRVLAPKFGGFLTFASLRNSSATAPGQPTIMDLLSLYRFGAIGRATRVYGVIGWPVAHSVSPHIHNAGFEAVGNDGVYLPLPVPPEWEHFKASLGALLDYAPLDFAGASVTIPHKEHLLRFAREDQSREWSIDPVAEIAGAANTLVVEGGACRVANTDAPAVARLLAPLLGQEGLRGRRVAVLGSGGMARSAAAAAALEGGTVMVYSRTRERADRLAAEVTGALERVRGGIGRGERGRIVAGPWEKRCAERADAFIQCTPVGMAGGPDPESSPMRPDDLAKIGEDAVLLETVYRPRVTPLVEFALERGLRVVDGAELFVEQAGEQFALWTGKEAPAGLFRRVVDESLG